MITRATLQVICVLLILLIIFGPPNDLGTVLGLIGAGLTVALKDFIVGFLGWFVLMGKNGIRIGDLVEINGVIVPLVGRVTMDMVMLDVEDTPVEIGDTAVLFGGLVSLDDQAALAGTISYELLTMLTPRVARRYRNQP
jgi:small-conductance mechanosensitive channel